ncbi:hypothetical protein BDV06DRAFT_205708 [Aspergillus oleicola]
MCVARCAAPAALAGAPVVAVRFLTCGCIGKIRAPFYTVPPPSGIPVSLNSHDSVLTSCCPRAQGSETAIRGLCVLQAVGDAWVMDDEKGSHSQRLSKLEINLPVLFQFSGSHYLHG